MAKMTTVLLIVIIHCGPASKLMIWTILIVFTVCAMHVTLIQIKTVAGKQEAQDKSLNQRMIAN